MIPKTRTPLYRILKLDIEEKILEGKLMPGELLPTEYQLCQQYQVSRITVRKALDQLESEGLISRQHGRGTYVRLQTHLLSSRELTGYTRSMIQQGHTPRSEVLESSLVPGDVKLLRSFGLPPDSPQQFWHFLRIRYIAGQPGVISNHYVLREFGDRMRENDLNNTSFYALYEKIYGQPVRSSDVLVSAVSASEENARLLGLEPGAALIWYRAVNSFLDGTVAEVDQSFFRPDRFMFEYHLDRTEGEGIVADSSDLNPYSYKP